MNKHLMNIEMGLSDLAVSRAQGCLMGQIAGDALGSAVEFMDRDTIARRHPDGVTRLTDGGTWNLLAGQPTDDSEMALALARSLVSKGAFIEDEVARGYIEWRASGPFDIGGTTSAGIAALERGQRSQSRSQANGALMRCSPLGIFAAGDPIRAAHLARLDAALTHPSPVCTSASAAYCAAIASGIMGADEDAMLEAALEHAGRGNGADLVRERLHLARTERPSEFQHQMGWVLTALQNAFFALMQQTPIGDAVIATVAQGGDTDTNGAICGALLGAAQGIDAVPCQWKKAVLSCRPEPGKEVVRPRPAIYWPVDTLELSENLLVAGKHEGVRHA